ncbi:hypothetical protein WMY93_021527 [Mugilogobius chulae]|uniref:Uncharacterized protein n=1 Tax=Mugilogobius chulae TaxID=88201 RepID=A0AAW0NFW3_9GOBI
MIFSLSLSLSFLSPWGALYEEVITSLHPPSTAKTLQIRLVTNDKPSFILTFIEVEPPAWGLSAKDEPSLRRTGQHAAYHHKDTSMHAPPTTHSFGSTVVKSSDRLAAVVLASFTSTIQPLTSPSPSLYLSTSSFSSTSSQRVNGSSSCQHRSTAEGNPKQRRETGEGQAEQRRWRREEGTEMCQWGAGLESGASQRGRLVCSSLYLPALVLHGRVEQGDGGPTCSLVFFCHAQVLSWAELKQ